MTIYSVETQFENKKAIVREIYDVLMAAMADWQDVKATPKKTSIHIDHHTSFAGVHPRKQYINLNIRTDYPIESNRITKREKVSKNRYHQVVRLDAPSEVDDELLGWLREAYLVGSK